MRMDLVGIWKMSGKKLIFFSGRKHFLNFPKLIFYRFPTNLSHSNLRPKFFSKNLQNEHLSALLNFSALNVDIRKIQLTSQTPAIEMV